MCGRYTLTRPAEIQAILDDLATEHLEVELPPRFNIAPTQLAPIVTNRADRALEVVRWGLVPHWADDPSIGARMINARAETLATKPAFRDALAARRCLVPADGFYEWRTEGMVRRPLWIHPAPRRIFCFAGLWATWRAKDGEPLRTFTIITSAANDQVAPYHDRMPVIVEPADWERWLHPEALPVEALADILAPGRSPLAIEPVSTAVNSVANDGPECLRPPEQPSLF
jgi:putative SOS response-associated peptidase YedK